MAAPTLNDYEYMFKDTGLVLNGTSAVPFIDVQAITGLDMPSVQVVEETIDGQHGGDVYAKYFEPRTIIIDSVVYANPASVDSFLDTLYSNFMIDDIEYPFYFKGTGVGQRYVMCKAIGLNCPTDVLRTIGSAKLQLQLKAGDPRKYVDNVNQTMVANTNYSPVNAGNMNTYPVFTITGAWSTITLTNNTQVRSVVLTDTRVAGDITVVDFKKKSVIVNGVRKSTIVTTGNWWDIPPGGGNTVKFTVTGGPPTSVVMATKQGWV